MNPPLVSVLMPVFDPPEPCLRAAIESVLRQVYTRWQLCIADDASTAPYTRAVLEEYARLDARIQLTFRSERGNIAETAVWS